ncbi:MAG TPA: hypothetical protein VIW92_05915 [Thermoanaerobaculia bacterium]
MRSMKAAALALAVVFLASLLAAQTPLPGPEIPVSTGREFPMFPHVATAANGDFAVVWESAGAASPYRVWMRRFAPNGKAKGRDVLVSRPKGAGTNQTDARIAMTPGGGFMVVWESGNIAFHSAVFGRCFAASGKPLGPAFQLNAGDPARLQMSPEVAAAPDGSFVATWASGPNPYGQEADIFVRRFAADGDPLGPAFKVEPWSSIWQNHPRVAVSGNGDFLVAWVADLGSSSSYGVVAQRFDAEAGPLGGRFQATPSPGIFGHYNEFAMAMTEDGESLFVWINSIPGAPPNSSGLPPYGILGQRVTADGRQDGGLLIFQEIPSNLEVAPAAVALPGGGYFVAWGTFLLPSTIFGQRLSGEGVLQGPALRINPLGAGYHPALAVAPNGKGVVTWIASVRRRSAVLARVLAF